MRPRIDPTEIQYMGMLGHSRSCLAAVEDIVTSDTPPTKATLVSSFDNDSIVQPIGEHLFLFWNWNYVPLTIVQSGFSSGYSGTGPTAFSLALCMIVSKGVQLDLKEVDSAKFKEIENRRITHGIIESVRYRDSAANSEADVSEWIGLTHREKLDKGNFWEFYYGEPEMNEPSKYSEVPTTFLSYSWDDESHKEWVRQLAKRLRQDGVETILDQWEIQLGDQLPEFMESAIRDNRFVVIICTPHYKTRSDNRIGGVGYEGDIITAEVMGMRSHRKFIPILRSGSWKESAPTWIAGKSYVDLSGDQYSEENYRDLKETLLGIREVAPPVGGGSPSSPAPAALQSLERYCQSAFRRWSELVERLGSGSEFHFPNGHFELAFGLVGVRSSLGLADIRKRLDAAGMLRTSGPQLFYQWPNLWTPYPYETLVESWSGYPTENPQGELVSSLSTSEFWRVSADGQLYALRGYLEDFIQGQGMQQVGSTPGSIFDVKLAIDNLVSGVQFARQFGEDVDGVRAMAIRCRFTGLSGRVIDSIDPNSLVRLLTYSRRTCRTESSVQELENVALQDIRDDIGSVVHQLLAPVCELFDFYELAPDYVSGRVEALQG